MSELLSLFAESPATFAIVLFLFGACVGSFLNVVILRLPDILFWQWRMQCHDTLDLPDPEKAEAPPGLLYPHSRCPGCKNRLTAIQNIPILGYIFLGGRCGFCKQQISLRYPVVEIVTAILWVQCGLHFGVEIALVLSLILVSAFVVLTVIDLDHHLLPDIIVIPLLWLGLIANSFNVFTSLESALFGAVAGYLVLWIIYQVHHRLTGKEGMGYGDFKLLACIGAWMGWEMLPVVILLASFSGTIIAITLMLVRRQGRDIPVAFGPYLAIAGWIAFIWGDTIVRDYLQIFTP